MKDESHHMAKFLEKFTPKDSNPDMKEEEQKLYAHEKGEEQIKKQKKQTEKHEREERTPDEKTPDERNKEMKKRTPQIRERSHKTKISK